MSKSAVVAFGRVNPPTKGHELLLNKVKAHADAIGADHHVFLSQSQDAKKNPLSHDDKIHALKTLMPHINVASDKHVKTPIDMLKHLHNQGYKEVHVHAGADRAAHFHKLFNHYNGGPDYNFDKIHIHSAGDRDPDSDDVTGISGTKMRGFVSSGDHENFHKNLAGSPTREQSRSIFDKVHKGMTTKNLKENDDGFVPDAHYSAIKSHVAAMHGPDFKVTGLGKSSDGINYEAQHQHNNQTVSGTWKPPINEYDSDKPEGDGLDYAGGMLEDQSQFGDVSGINDILRKMGAESPAHQWDDHHDTANPGEHSMTNMKPISKKVDVAEPDGDADDLRTNIPDFSQDKPWEYGYPRGELKHTYPRSTGYSTAGALVQFQESTKTFKVGDKVKWNHYDSGGNGSIKRGKIIHDHGNGTFNIDTNRVGSKNKSWPSTIHHTLLKSDDYPYGGALKETFMQFNEGDHVEINPSARQTPDHKHGDVVSCDGDQYSVYHAKTNQVVQYGGLDLQGINHCKDCFDSGVYTESAPPDEHIEDWIKNNKARFTKEYGERGSEVLYAKAWKMYREKGKSHMSEGLTLAILLNKQRILKESGIGLDEPPGSASHKEKSDFHFDKASHYANLMQSNEKMTPVEVANIKIRAMHHIAMHNLHKRLAD